MSGRVSGRRDLVILGGGLVGMTLALAAARQGITSHVVDKATPEQLTAEGADGRASAISTASWNLFANIGLADRLAPLGCPIAAIAVTDQMKPGRIDFQPGAEDGSLGRMYANRDIRTALFEAARAEPAIAWHSGTEAVERERGEHGVRVVLDNGEELTGSLLIAAEGRKSPTRDEAGLVTAKWDYHHRAIVTALYHEKSHENVAWEIFYPAGPSRCCRCSMTRAATARRWSGPSRKRMPPGCWPCPRRCSWARSSVTWAGCSGRSNSPRRECPIRSTSTARRELSTSGSR